MSKKPIIKKIKSDKGKPDISPSTNILFSNVKNTL